MDHAPRTSPTVDDALHIFIEISPNNNERNKIDSSTLSTADYTQHVHNALTVRYSTKLIVRRSENKEQATISFYTSKNFVRNQSKWIIHR